MSQTALIDYGSGNLPSAEKALSRAAFELGSGGRVLATCDPEQILRSERVVLPGVGAFSACMGALKAREGLIEALIDKVLRQGAPFLGICVGMQLLAERGLELGGGEGLGWIGGVVRRLEPDRPAKVPHVGWNDVAQTRPSALFAPGAGPFYFTHSFALEPARPEDASAIAEHGGRFVAAVERENVAGVQFHPEKSQVEGLALLARFLRWRP